MSTFLTFLVWLLMGLLCSHLAVKRGRDRFAWFAIGLFFGIFGLLLLFLLSPLNEDGSVNEETKDEENGENQIIVDVPVTGVEVTANVPEKQDLTFKQWFYIVPGNKRAGPVDFIKLKDLWNKQTINSSMFVWSEGMDTWKKIDEIPLLQETLNNAISQK